MGNILNKELFNVPQDVDKFKSSNVSKEIKNKILEVLNS
jgi:hypothetical protein